MALDTSYLHIGSAADLKHPRERAVYRVLEMIPGVMTWGVFVVAVLGSWLFPILVSIFIIVFVIYWFTRLFYLAFHLRFTYKQMRINEAVNWREKLDSLSLSDYSLPVKDWRDVYHLVVVPTYKEPLAIVRATLQSIRKNDYPSERLIVVLGIEERAGKEDQEQAELLAGEFKNEFFRFLVTVHPKDIRGELPGKASNETWATRKAKEEVIDKERIPYERILVTSVDADTYLYPGYFSCLTHTYLTTQDPLRVSFQPIPLFFNNIQEAPAISRVFAFNSTFWHMINQSRPEKLITFSTHSMGFQQLVDVGFKQTNVVSDDSRIFWQCFLWYDGNYRTQPLYYPVSMDANAAPTLLQTIKNIYRQQRRWAYGVADVPYFVFGIMKNRAIPWRKKFSPAWEVAFGFWSWATASVLIFMLGWLPLVIGGTEFSQSLLSYNMPRLVGLVLRVGLIGLVASVYLTFFLLPGSVAVMERKKVVFFALQWILLPFTMILASVPALEAQTRLLIGKYLGFWATPKFRDSSLEPASSK